MSRPSRANHGPGPAVRFYRLLAGLRFRILALGLLGVLPAVYFVGTAAMDQERADEQQARAEAYRLASLICSNETRTIEAARVLLSTLARLPQVQSGAERECNGLFRSLLAGNPDLLNIGYTDTTGLLRCSAVRAAGAISLSDRVWFQECVRGRAFAVGTYQMGRITRQRSINAAEPVFDPAGRLWGVVYAAIGLQSFQDLASSVHLPQGATLTVIDRAGTILARYPEGAPWTGVAPRGETLLDSTLAVRDGTFQGADIDGVQRFFACAPLLRAAGHGAGYVCVGIAKSSTFAPAHAALAKTFLGLGIAALVALAGSWLLGYVFIVRPTRALARAFRRLAAGDLRARSEVPRGAGELHHLAVAFDQMADVLERRQRDAERARAALHESERRFRLFMDNSPLVAFIKDADRRQIYVNSTGAGVFGRPVREILGRTNADIFPPEVAEVIDRNDLQVLTSGRPTETTEQIPGPKGAPVTFIVLRFPVPQPDGRRLLGGVAVDITARQRLEEQFRQAQKLEAVGRLAGGVAHDFNNLLTAILGYAQLLARRLPDGHAGQRDASEIQSAAERAAALTRQLLAFSRRDASQPRPIDLNAVVSGMGNMLRRLIGEDVDLVVSTRADLRTILADPGQIEQVLMNLVVNARDAIPQGGHITIETLNLAVGEAPADEPPGLPPGAYVALVVSDDGTGMDAETKGRIFEPFFTTKGPEKGTGLGLSTVYGIVQQAGGSIQVESERGRGTTFRLCFPAVERRAERPAAEGEGDSLPPGTETVLVVEDQDAVAAVIRGTLETCGYTVLSARDGREALGLIDRHVGPIHLLLCDVVLPEAPGPEVAKRVWERCPAIRTLFMSGYTERALPGSGRSGEDVAFLQKPFTPVALSRRVRAMLDASRAAAA